MSYDQARQQVLAKGSFNRRMSAISTTLSTKFGQTIDFIMAKNAPTTYPSIRTYFIIPNGFQANLFQFKQLIQVSVNTNIDQDEELAFLIAGGILEELNIDVSHQLLKSQIHKWDYDATPPVDLGPMDCWLDNPPIGFMERDDPDPNVTHLSCDFKLLHK